MVYTGCTHSVQDVSFQSRRNSKAQGTILRQARRGGIGKT